MVKVKLPDGSVKEYQQSISPLAVAGDISQGLARAAIAARVDGKLVDLTFNMADGEHELQLLTNRDKESLEILRHTAAHVLAMAVVRLYGPTVQYTIGPALLDDFQYGFYYDFALPCNISVEDLSKIEAEMKKIVSEKLPFRREELSAAAAKSLLGKRGQKYKCEMIDDMLAAGEGAVVSLYHQGEGPDAFVDMCRGPHLSDTGKLGNAFKLMAVAGAYWRGDEKNPMLTRIYGNAFFDKKELAEHLDRIEQAKKRDHRVLGKQLSLFLLDEKVGPGMAMWLPRGATIRMELENWLRGELIKGGYSIVYSPHIGKLDLYRTSGHYPYYKESQFPPIMFEEDGKEDGFLLKPMNCPHHIMMYKSTQHSYRELPIRLAEFGQVYRWEQSGELNGLTRVRAFCQDDAHIFCAPEQLESEISACIDLVKLVLSTLGLNDYRVRISLRDPNSDKYVGSDENWNLAEANIRSVVKASGMDYSEALGEAAFYGPKIDFIVKDCIGREWQLGTVQVDYNLPERFELEYIGRDNSAHRPVMIHRAPFGSLERFIGILIEHFGGAFPLWLSPVQVAVLPVSDKVADYAAAVTARLKSAGLRVELDESADKIGAKIRRATMNKIPYMAVIGAKEADSQTVSVRERIKGDIGEMAVENFKNALVCERDTKGKELVQI
ncbi:MAG TPA: threonine--tRNA ligase [Phycisphaerae bacterium]|nr:threonine--tRNA ligase [Phycisphaerae bacterium]